VRPRALAVLCHSGNRHGERTGQPGREKAAAVHAGMVGQAPVGVNVEDQAPARVHTPSATTSAGSSSGTASAPTNTAAPAVMPSTPRAAHNRLRDATPRAGTRRRR
jgi:hypothetical protein